MMKSVILCLILSLTSPLVFAQDAGKDCTCPKVTCGPCQKKIPVGKIVKFCDWGDINVCRKYVCENKNDYFQCLTNYKNEKKSKKQEGTGDLELVYEQNLKPTYSDDGKKPVYKKKAQPVKRDVSFKKDRQPTSVEEEVKPSARDIASEKVFGKDWPDKVQLETAGRIEVSKDSSRVVVGTVYSEQTSGYLVKNDKGLKYFHRGYVMDLEPKKTIYVDDEIINETKKTQSFQLKFDQGVVSFKLQPQSKLLVQDPFSIAGRFQPFFYLVHGGLTMDVDFKDQATVDVLAGQILSQAQTGKHSINYEMSERGLEVRVEAQAGELAVLKAQDLSGKKINVTAGNFLSWVSETPKALFDQDEKMALAAEGFITPVFQLSMAKRKKLGLIQEPPKLLLSQWPEREHKGRDLASVGFSSELCQKPAAKFEQCAWSCENNPKGAKTCEAERSGTHCVRRVCNAAGQWGVPTAFASSYKDLCPSSGTRVGDCSP